MFRLDVYFCLVSAYYWTWTFTIYVLAGEFVTSGALWMVIFMLLTEWERIRAKT